MTGGWPGHFVFQTARELWFDTDLGDEYSNDHREFLLLCQSDTVTPTITVLSLIDMHVGVQRCECACTLISTMSQLAGSYNQQCICSMTTM